MVGLDEIDAVAGFSWLPVLVYRRAAEDQGDDVAEQVASDEAHDGPSGVSERCADSEESKVHEQQRYPVPEDAD